MMKRIAWVLIAMTLGANAADRLAIKGLTLGAGIAETQPRFSAGTCRTGVCMFIPRAGQPDNELRTFASQPVDYIAAHFNDDKISGVSVKMSMASANTVANALTEKYGKPERTEEPFKTRGGASTTQITLKWIQGDEMLVLIAPYGSIDKMNVNLASREFVRKFNEGNARKAAGDL